MKLYYLPGACSLASHIVIKELGLNCESIKVTRGSKEAADGRNLKDINPKGQVPALLLDNGEVLTESAVLVQYLADQKPEAGLIPAYGTWQRYRTQEFLNYIATELHKGYGMLFNPAASEERKAEDKANLEKKFTLLSSLLGDKPYALGDTFSVADAYLFTVLSWTKRVGVDLSPWENLSAFVARVGSRPAVIAALQEEGLI